MRKCERGVRHENDPFYQALEKILREANFDRRVEAMCRKFYAEKQGRPSIPPGVYFRCLMIGFFEGIDSERDTSAAGRSILATPAVGNGGLSATC